MEQGTYNTTWAAEFNKISNKTQLHTVRPIAKGLLWHIWKYTWNHMNEFGMDVETCEYHFNILEPHVESLSTYCNGLHRNCWVTKTFHEKKLKIIILMVV